MGVKVKQLTVGDKVAGQVFLGPFSLCFKMKEPK